MILAACQFRTGAGTAREPDKLPQDGGSLVAREHLYLAVRAAEQQTSAQRCRESKDGFCGSEVCHALGEHNGSGRRCNG